MIQEVFSIGSWLQIIGIIVMIFVDEQTLVILCKNLTCSIMTMFQNEKIILNFDLW